MSGWAWALTVYLSLSAITLLPVLRALIKWAPLNPGGPSFDKSPHFTDPARELLVQNFQRMEGTLKFWKAQAERYRLFHFYSLSWIGIASVTVPLLAQATTNNRISKLTLTVVATHSAILLTLSRSFRVEAHYKAFRNGESEFYDIYRRILDRPAAFGKTEDERLARYFEQVEMVRRLVRAAETDNFPSIEDIAQGKKIDPSQRSSQEPEAPNSTGN